MMSFTVPDWFKSILLFYLALFGRLEDCACKKKTKQKKTKKHLCDFFSFQNFLEYSSSGTYCVNFQNLSSHRDYHSKIMDTKSLWDTLHIISTFLLIQWYLDLKIPSWVLWRQSCLFFFFISPWHLHQLTSANILLFVLADNSLRSVAALPRCFPDIQNN